MITDIDIDAGLEICKSRQSFEKTVKSVNAELKEYHLVGSVLNLSDYNFKEFEDNCCDLLHYSSVLDSVNIVGVIDYSDSTHLDLFIQAFINFRSLFPDAEMPVYVLDNVND